VTVAPTGPEAPQERPLLGISLANVQNGWNERVSSEGGCVFSIILWIVIIVVVLLALGYFARGRRR
jgi:uncharacterized membrane protein